MSVTIPIEASILLKVTNNNHAEEVIESIARPTIGMKDFHQIAGLAIWIMDNEDLKKANLVPNTLSLSAQVGLTLKTLTSGENPINPWFLGQIRRIIIVLYILQYVSKCDEWYKGWI